MKDELTMNESTKERVNKNLTRRYAAEKRFRYACLGSVLTGLVALAVLIVTIVGNGFSGFQQAYIKLTMEIDHKQLGVTDPDDLSQWQYADYRGMIREALKERFPDADTIGKQKEIFNLVSSFADFQVSRYVIANKNHLDTQFDMWVATDDDVDAYLKDYIDTSLPESERRISDSEIKIIKLLEEQGELKLRFNKLFFTEGDSREPEQAGIRGAMLGSFFTLVVTLFLSFPIGVAAAVYLEEFAPKNKWTDIIEVNINNLAAVPSIVFGLLGLAVFLNFFGMPRSVPLVGGVVLTLMTLPTIIISSRAALKAVPPSIREAAYGLGASRMQTVFDHVLPLAMPGMLTGAIIGMAQALGETAPLLMIGMVAFIVDIPQSFFDPATVLPVQIYLWSDSPERTFVERTSAAIMVLLFFLVIMNALAVLLRRYFERRW